jgi:hypothetical protein
MMKIRVVNKDGIDEFYKDVLKMIKAGDNFMIYTKISTFSIPSDEVLFMQAWDEASE